MSEAARSVSPIVPAPNVAASRCWCGAVSRSPLAGPGPQGVQYTHIDLVEPRKGRDLDAASVTELVHRGRASHSADTHILTRDAEIIRPCVSTGHLREEATLIPIENPWMRVRQAAWNEGMGKEALTEFHAECHHLVDRQVSTSLIKDRHHVRQSRR